MNIPRALLRLGCSLALITAVYAFQKPFRVYMSLERQDDIPLPPDYQNSAEWVFARLMYPNHPNALFGRRGRYGRFFNGGYPTDWREGGTSWSQDYPRADRHFAAALRRLTRIDVRSVEQPVNPDDLDDFYNWPMLAVGELGDWKLTDAQIKVVREYLLRGGFMMLDDFWGPDEWARFDETMSKIFPEAKAVEMPNDDSIFHVVYDLDDRFQVPGMWGLSPYSRQFQERAVGTKAHWMGIYDQKGRVMVAMSFNSDLGDSWEWADSPTYPEKYSALGIRIAVNDVVYAMSH